MMIEINWKKDYQGEFSCIHCGQSSLKFESRHSDGKYRLKCISCGRRVSNSYTLKERYLSSRLEGYGLACPSPDCQARQVVLKQIQYRKKCFQCAVCGATAVESNDIISSNLSRYGQIALPIKPFNFEEDIWDLRAITTAINGKADRYFVNFSDIQTNWLKNYIKKYIIQLCKINKPFSNIDKHLTSFRYFSNYLTQHNINSITEINRNLVLDFICVSQTGKEGITLRLRSLRQLFMTGNLHGWFRVDPDIIRDSDYPKKNLSNPDPIPDAVREQIEENLHKLPDPIARMWIVAFFAAIRPSELALLKKDCLVQEGDKWTLVWWRSKGKSYHQHSVPINRTIARVIQEQKAYIEDLWGDEWEYLFCHYQNISQSDLTHPKLKPVKKVIPRDGSPLQKVIRTLIKAEKILDDNGQLAEFSPRLIRHTRLTELFHKGHDLAVVSAWAGHRRLATTANFYIEISCQEIAEQVGHIQIALVNLEGKKLNYESMPKSFWENPTAHELILSGTHVNTPIYGYCGLPLEEDCEKFRACYTCCCFVSKPEKLPLYIQQRDELREKESQALEEGHDVLVEQFGSQADQLDKIIASLQEVT
jgi:integrase/transcription elongation factor Elf1